MSIPMLATRPYISYVDPYVGHEIFVIRMSISMLVTRPLCFVCRSLCWSRDLCDSYVDPYVGHETFVIRMSIHLLATRPF